jgi:hypothetical protein
MTANSRVAQEIAARLDDTVARIRAYVREPSISLEGEALDSGPRIAPRLCAAPAPRMPR